jgi:ferredoxin-type protein NapG
LVQGKIGEHYRLGWTFDTQITQEFKPAQAPALAPTDAPPPSQAPGMDYLNSGGGL